MGITIPKLPIINPFSSGAKSSASGLVNTPRKPRVKKLPIGIVPPPEWVEQIDCYFVSSCVWHDSGRFGGCFVVEYAPNDRSVSGDRGFVKIYAADDLNGTPFVQMKGIWKDIHEDKTTHSISYDITEDGRIYNGFGDFPSDDNIRDAIYDIGSMYHDWRDFPTAQDWDTVCKLREAAMAVDNLRIETKYSHGQNNIDNLRKKIKEIQTQIAQAEKSLNEMYEKAADGMNFLEEHGIVVNLDEEPKQPEKLVADCDFSSLYPQTGMLMYSGQATIMRMSDGSYNVTPKGTKHTPKAGEMVYDPGSGLNAVYSYGKWVVLNT